LSTAVFKRFSPAAVYLIALFGFWLPADLPAQEEISRQLWGNILLGFPRTEKLYFEADFEPKVLLSPDNEWRNLDVIPLLEYYPLQWLDLTAEAVLGQTRQTDNLRTFELSPKLGMRFRIIGHLWKIMATGERIPIDRFNLSTLIRVERRILWYSGEKTTERSTRLRFRLETKIAINHAWISLDNTWYLFADAEKFWNIGRNVSEAFNSKFRIRIGPGYRLSYKQRFELLLIYDFARNTIEEDLSKDVIILDLRYKMFF
jgi:hypothetical protein